MKLIKVIFLISLAVWLGVVFITWEYGSRVKAVEMLAYGVTDRDKMMLDFRGVAIGLFAPVAIISGLLLLGGWLYKLSVTGKEESARDTAPPPGAPAAPKLASHTGNAVPSQPSTAGDKLNCKFTGWAREGNRVAQEYTYSGQGLQHRMVVEFKIEKGTYSILRFAHFWLFPANGFEGQGEVRILDRTTGENTGWLPSRLATAKGNATLFGFEGREPSDAVFRMFMRERELLFEVRHGGEDLLKLPMPNELGLEAHYQQIRSDLDEF